MTIPFKSHLFGWRVDLQDFTIKSLFDMGVAILIGVWWHQKCFFGCTWLIKSRLIECKGFANFGATWTRSACISSKLFTPFCFWDFKLINYSIKIPGRFEEHLLWARKSSTFTFKLFEWINQSIPSSLTVSIIVLIVLASLCAVLGAIYAYIYYTRINPRSARAKRFIERGQSQDAEDPEKATHTHLLLFRK